mgnify:CR=1 FL=1
MNCGYSKKKTYKKKRRTKGKKRKGKGKKRTNRRNQRAGSYTFGFNNPIINGSPEVLQYYRCYDPEPPFDRSALVGGGCDGNPYYLKDLLKGGKCGLCGNMKKRRTQKKSKSKKGKKGKGKKGKGRKRSRNQRGGNQSSVFTGNMTERAFGCRQPYWSPPCV